VGEALPAQEAPALGLSASRMISSGTQFEEQRKASRTASATSSGSMTPWPPAREEQARAGRGGTQQVVS
jgi:hypothetical protein